MQLGAGLCINVAPLACRAGESPDQGRGSTRLLQDEMIPTPSASSAGQGGHLGPRPGPPDWPPLTGTSRASLWPRPSPSFGTTRPLTWVPGGRRGWPKVLDLQGLWNFFTRGAWATLGWGLLWGL